MWNLNLSRNSEWSLARQIYRQVSSLILDGRLAGGEALPSTRELARDLGVSRHTVSEAYEMLLAEGYLCCSQGAPTRVAPDISRQRQLSADRSGSPAHAGSEANQRHRRPIRYDFRTGRPDLSQFPLASWRKAAGAAVAELDLANWGYADAAGLPALRAEIAAWLFRSRGMTVAPDDVFITAGATHALCIAVDLLGGPGRPVMMEDPCHIGLYQVLQSRHMPVIPLEIDQHGILAAGLDHPEAAAIYVTPSHQFPIGGILPAGRRSALIQSACRYGQYILEDDYDSEFRYGGEPVSPLWSLAPDRVIYIGTFSKTLFPAIRIGYAIVPSVLQKQWRFLRTHMDVQNPPFEQAALAGFLRSRQFDRHVRRMRRIYAGKRNLLLQGLHMRFGDNLQVLGDAAGLHVAVALPDCRLPDDIIRKAREQGIRLATARHHSIRQTAFADTLILGFGHLEREALPAAVEVLADFIADETGQGSIDPCGQCH